MPSRPPLPIDAVLHGLIAAVRDHGCAVLTAPPGSGKTTRVPPALASAVDGRVLVLEPRRMAARAAARRVAKELGCAPGTDVGWQVRGEDRTSRSTRVIFATEGVLLRRLVADPFLEGVGAVVFDEFHERSVDADLALALVASVRAVRPELAVVVMSATLDAGPVARFLGAPTIHADGALFPVDVRHDARVEDEPLERRVAAAVRELWAGDRSVLVFLPGLSEIRRAADALGDLPTATLHGRLDPREQDAVLDPDGPPCVILSTNVAESSLTVPNVRGVVDSGLARVARLDPGTGLDRLDVLPIAKDSADQRAGRAGRSGPGVCRRLWTARDHADRPDHTVPALHRSDLAGAVLTLLAFGEPDPRAFAWFEPPRPDALGDALALLERLGATADGRLTAVGRVLADLPLHPRLGRFVLEAHARGAGARGAALAVWLAEGGRPAGDLDETRPPPGDSARLLAALRDHASSGREEPRALDRAALAAWPDRLGRRRDADDERGAGVLVGGVGVVGAAHPLFVAVGLDPSRRTARGEWQVSLQAPVDPEWLPITTTHEARFDGERVVGVEVRRAGELVLHERVGARPDPSVAAGLLADAVRAAWERSGPAGTAWTQLRGRLAFLARWRPHPDLPDGSLGSLESVIDAMCTQHSRLEDVWRASWVGAVKEGLSWEARLHLDAHAPERIRVASGQDVRLDWTCDPPVLAARIQHLFGTVRTPEVCGRPVVVHLLAPNGRPQQITSDLPGFWSGSYAEVRKALRARYPKHAWPEDPTGPE